MSGKVAKAAAERKPRPAKDGEANSKTIKTAASHPPYFEMIKEALAALKEKSGSSPYAIAKCMEQKYGAVLPPNFRKFLNLQLKNCVGKGKLIKIKASYKLSEEAAGKKEDKAAKKVGKKRKTTPAKAKQPKSIKSPNAKKAGKKIKLVCDY
ncbi:histone H1 [Andrographis paniculata]|uniref:histone H1 n=1 Tax=Andrographis paniculata TaxID=175694 RepID=UPI0021E8BE34|nr:histone H1 [Andrographis paniculata]